MAQVKTIYILYIDQYRSLQLQLSIECTHSHPHCLRRNKLSPDSIFTRTVSLWNDLPRGSFLDYYNLNLFKSSVNLYLVDIST